MARRSKTLTKSRIKQNSSPDFLFRISRTPLYKKYSRVRNFDLMPKATRKLAKRLSLAPVLNPVRKLNPVHQIINHVQTLESVRPVVCAARKVRRAVLFARGKAGGNHKPPRRTPFSNIRC